MKIHDYSADSAECLGFIGQGEGIPIPDWETSMDALKELGVNALNFKCFAKPPAETPNEEVHSPCPMKPSALDILMKSGRKRRLPEKKTKSSGMKEGRASATAHGLLDRKAACPRGDSTS